MDELLENDKEFVSEPITVKSPGFFLAFFNQWKERLIIYVITVLALFIGYNFLLLKIDFVPTGDTVLLFLWVLAVFIFKLPAGASIVGGIFSLIIIPFSLIYSAFSLVEPTSTLVFFLFLLGILQLGLESLRKNKADEIDVP